MYHTYGGKQAKYIPLRQTYEEWESLELVEANTISVAYIYIYIVIIINLTNENPNITT